MYTSASVNVFHNTVTSITRASIALAKPSLQNKAYFLAANHQLYII